MTNEMRMKWFYTEFITQWKIIIIKIHEKIHRRHSFVLLQVNRAVIAQLVRV